MVKVAICDDDHDDGEKLEAAFDELPQYEVEYDIFFSAKELLKHKNEENYNMYFLDIEMPGLNGIGLAERIRREDKLALIVFLTSHDSYVMDTFKVFTFDFIRKPITVDKLKNVIDNAMQYINLTKQDFVFKFRRSQFRVSSDEILYIEKKGRQAMIHTPVESFITNMTNEELWKQLDVSVFSHIHISYIINLKHIRAIQGNEVILDNGEHFLVARSRKQELKEKHMEFVKKWYDTKDYT